MHLRFDKFISKAIDLTNVGNKNTRSIIKNLLSPSFDTEFLKQRQSSECKKHVGIDHEVATKKKSVLEEVRYSTLRKTFTHLQ